MDVSSDDSWEPIVETTQPLPRPAQCTGPRIASPYQLNQNRPLAKPKSISVARRHNSAGEALARPAIPASNSSGPSRSLQDLQECALTRPVSNVAVASSLCLGRELPQLSSKTVADHFKKPDVTTNRQTHQPAKRLRAAPAGKPVAITRVRHTSESSAVQALLPKFLTMYMIYSDLLTRLHSSENSTAHLMRILDGFSPNTIF